MSEPVRILIVEDSPTDFDLAQREIRKAVSECVFLQVQTRKDLLRALDTFQPDLILSDYQMPRFDGITALKLAREHAKLTPFIIWTGTMGEDIAVECMKAGAVNYILKENIKRLGPAVAHALEERRLLLEHKQAEETTLANEKRFRALIENGQDNISLLSAKGVLLWESPATIRALGYPQDEFLGRNIFELIHPDDLHWTSDLFSKLIQEPGSREHGVFRLQHSDGTWRWNEAIVTNMLNEASVNAIVVNYRDITERKQAENVLREAETKYRTLVEQLPAVTYLDLVDDSIKSGEFTTKYVSPQVEGLLGYTPKEFQSDPGLWARLIHPADRERILARNVEHFRTHGFYGEEYRMLTRKGHEIWVRDEAIVVRGENHETALSQGVVFDITEQKKAEERLRLSDQILQRVNALVLVANAQGSIVYISPASKTLLGYEPDELMGDSWWKLSRSEPIEAQREKEYIGRAARGEMPIVTEAYERAIQDRSGNTRWISWVDAAGPSDLLIGVGHDITERKQTEEALRLSESKYRMLVENSLQGIAIYQDQRMVYANPALCKINGYSAEELLAMSTDQIIAITHPDDRDIAQERAKKRMAGETVSSDIEMRIIRKDGSMAWLQAYNNPIMYAGRPALLSTVLDITGRKQAEERLHESEQRYRALFEDTPVAIWEEDFSQVKKYLDSLKQQGITDLPAYFEAHPEAVFECSRMIRILDVNNAALKMYQVDSKDELIKSTIQVLSNGEQEHNLEDFIAIADGKTGNSWEGGDKTLTGKPIEISLAWVVAPGHEQDFSKVIVTVTDITERKQAEKSIRMFADIVENIELGLYVFHLENREDDSSLRLVRANPAALQFSGVVADEIIGTYLDASFPELRAMGVPQKYAEVVRTGKAFELEVIYYDDFQIVDTVYAVKAFPLPDDHVGVAFENVTERKKAEDELRASEERFRQLADNIQEVFWITDPVAQKDVYISPAYEAVWGRGPESQMQNPNLFVESVLPEDKPAVLTAVEKQVHGEKTEMEYRISRPDGTVRWIWDRAFPIFDESGRVKNVAGIAADITERKLAENALRESEERFSNAFEFAPIGMALVSLDGHWLRVNQALCELTGYSAKELLKKTFQDITHPEDLDANLNYIGRMLAGELHFYQMEKRYFHKLGHSVWVQLHVTLIRDDDGRPQYFISQIQNVTERKQTEKETIRHLTELEALYENGLAVGRLLEPREIGDRIIQTFERYLSWHHVAIRLRQGESDDLELVAFSVPYMKEEEKNAVERNFNAMVSKVGQGLSGWVVQNGVPIRAGNVHLYPQYVDTYAEIRSGVYMPLKIGERIIGCISVESELPEAFTAQDERLLATLANQTAVAFENARLFQAAQRELSERMRAEELLEHERTSLAQRVDERTVDLSRVNENLERALKVKDEFLANMSHELRTPLNAILGLSESLAEQVAGSLNEKQQKYVTTISESGHHLLALINDILDLAKIEAGQITLDITKVDVHMVCHASLRLVKQQAQKKNQDIKLEIDENFGLIWADERRLKQMIVNLLSNAVKFTPENGKIGLEVHGDKGENRVLITVWDHGIGVEENDLSSLFQPFVQLDSGLARESSGTGLGLALVAQMARLHGGSVSVASVHGEGSRFTLVIPWQPALSADTIERMKVTGRFRAIKLNAGRQRTILLIEDTEEVILVVRDYLELAGFNVVVSRDGLDGITQAKLIHPDLILMDLQMPRMDGIEATQKLRGESDFQYTPIIALTALAMPNDRERCLAAGMDEYITKPVNLRALVKIIQGFLAVQEGTNP